MKSVRKQVPLVGLITLILATIAGQDKPAFEALRQEAAARGW